MRIMESDRQSAPKRRPALRFAGARVRVMGYYSPSLRTRQLGPGWELINRRLARTREEARANARAHTRDLEAGGLVPATRLEREYACARAHSGVRHGVRTLVDIRTGRLAG